MAEAKDDDWHWERLTKQARNKHASRSAVREWVSAHMGSPMAGIRVPPAPAAVTILRQAREDPKWFIDKFLAKLTMDEKETGQPGDLNEEDRTIDEMYGDFIVEMKRRMAEQAEDGD